MQVDHREGIKIVKPASRGGFLIAKIHQIAGRVFARKLKERSILDMNPARGRILFVLWEKDGIPVQELANRTGLEPSTLTRMLDRLEELGHIRRSAETGDRRKVLIHLTNPHQDLRPLYDEVSAEMTDLFYRGFSPSEVVLFESCLERILTNLEAVEARGPSDPSQGEEVESE